MDKNELEELEELAQTNPLVQKILTQWKEFYNSPWYDTYITVYRQIGDWNRQLTLKEITVVGENNQEEKVMGGRVDLFGSKDEKDFDRAWKYLSESVTMNEVLDKLRSKLSTEEIKNVKKERFLDKSKAVAI